MSYIGAEPDGKGSAERFIFTATASTTDTVTHADSGLAINYEANHVSVYLNGVKQVVGTDVTASNGSSLVFASNLTEDDVVEAIALSSFQPSDTVSASTGGTFTGAVTFSSGLSAGDANITNVGSLALDSISADGTSITISSDTALAAGVDIETSTTGKIKQKGSFMQSSFHQSLVLGG